MLFLHHGIVETRNLHSVTRSKTSGCQKISLHYKEGKYLNTIDMEYDSTFGFDRDFGALVGYFKGRTGSD